MIVVDQPETPFTYKRNLFSTDAMEFIAELEALPPATAVGHLAGKLQATRGVWVRVGTFRRTNGSFIDPSDLMLYVEQYYKPQEGGPVCALELNHAAELPEGAYRAATVEELLDALVTLDLEGEDEADEPLAAGAEEAAAEGAEAEAACSAAGAQENVEPAEDELPPSRFEDMPIVAPSGAFEMHGALADGWHAMYYEAADGTSLLVFD